MAQTSEGARKVLSAKAGIPIDEFTALLAAGQKWCMNCRSFHPRTAFGSDASRYDGLTPGCSSSRPYARKTSGPGAAARKAQAAAGLSWCRGCQKWQPSEGVRAGLCKPCARAYERARYAVDPAYRQRRKNHAYRRRGVEPMPEVAKEVLFETFRGTCAYCLKPAEAWDHALAVSLGGLTRPGNMLPACTSCNSRKRNKPLERWLQEVPNLEALTIEHLATFGVLF